MRLKQTYENIIKEVNLKNIPSNASVLKTTAKELFDAMWGDVQIGPNKMNFDVINKGYYDGTNIPLKKINPDSIVYLYWWSGNAVVVDEEGGWIADRFGPGVGVRDRNKAVQKIKGK